MLLESHSLRVPSLRRGGRRRVAGEPPPHALLGRAASAWPAATAPSNT